MSRIPGLRSTLAVGTVLIGLAAGGLLLYLERGLCRFGRTLGDAYQVLQAQHADAAAIRTAEDPITTPGGMSERGFVAIGGIRQWITIRGQDRNPVVLILQGGPGDATSQDAYFLRYWEKVFTVVQWDQRGAGRTYGLYKDATPDMTLERMIEDGAKVARYARQRTGQGKIVLMGHSWGSVLGVHLVKRHRRALLGLRSPPGPTRTPSPGCAPEHNEAAVAAPWT